MPLFSFPCHFSFLTFLSPHFSFLPPSSLLCLIFTPPKVVEAKKGAKLGDAAKARLAGRNAVSPGDLLLSNELLTRVVDKAKLRKALA